MRQRFFPLAILALILFTVGCSKQIENPSDPGEVLGKAKKVTTSSSTETSCDRISFEGYANGQILSEVTSEGGFGPIAMTSSNPRFLGQPHAAMIFDSDILGDPPSWDLGTPNEAFGGPGVGEAGGPGPFQNNVALGNLIVIKNFDVDQPPTEDDVNGTITFDFPGAVTVTASSITVIDVELTETESATVELLDILGNVIKTIQLPSTGQNGVAVVSLENTPGVASMKLNLNGSMGIDNIAFCRETPPTGGGCSYTQGFWKNHGPNPRGNNSNEFPVTSLTLGANSYTDVQLESILRTEVGGNGLISLAHQLIAAKLNVANGASATTIQTAITQADALISTLGASKIPPIGTASLDPSAVSSLVNTLTQYNEGKLAGGPSHCE